MQFLSDAEFAGRLLVESERNERISRHIAAARRHILLMVWALLLLGCTLVYDAQSMAYAFVAIAAFGLGYGTRAVVGHMRRARRRR